MLDLLKLAKLAMLARRRHEKVSGIILDWSLSEQLLGRTGRNIIGIWFFFSTHPSKSLKRQNFHVKSHVQVVQSKLTGSQCSSVLLLQAQVKSSSGFLCLHGRCGTAGAHSWEFQGEENIWNSWAEHSPSLKEQSCPTAQAHHGPQQ